MTATTQGVIIAAASALTVNANSVSADQVSGTYQFTKPGYYTLVAKGSATGLNVSLIVGGIAVVSDQPIMFTGTAGTISVKDNVMFYHFLNGGRTELKFRNTTGGGLTVDFQLQWSANAQ